MAKSCNDIVTDLYAGYRSHALVAASELGIFDYLANGKATPSQTAAALNTDCRATEQLMDFLASSGYLVKEQSKYDNGEGDDGEVFENSAETTKYLARNGLLSLMVPGIKLNLAFGQDLYHIVKDGPKHHDSKDWETKMLWLRDRASREQYYRNTQAAALIWYAPAVSSDHSFDLSQFTTACDLGGGSGDVAYAVAKRYPNMEMTIFDLPQVIATAKQYSPSNVPTNVTYTEGNFFESELPKVDLFIICSILVVLNDEKANILLSRVYEALKPGGACLLVECLFDDDKKGPPIAHTCDIMMLVKYYGKVRTRIEHRELLQNNGFVNVKFNNSRDETANTTLAFKPQ